MEICVGFGFICDEIVISVIALLNKCSGGGFLMPWVCLFLNWIWAPGSET